MSWRNELHDFYLKRVSGIPEPVRELGRDGNPMGYWMRMTIGKMQHFEKVMFDYRHDRQSFIDFMIHEGIDPLLMSDILDWQDTKDEMRKALLPDS